MKTTALTTPLALATDPTISELWQVSITGVTRGTELIAPIALLVMAQASLAQIPFEAKDASQNTMAQFDGTVLTAPPAVIATMLDMEQRLRAFAENVRGAALRDYRAAAAATSSSETATSP